MKKTLLFIARTFFVLIFLLSGIGKMMHWDEAVSSLIMTFSYWCMHLESLFDMRKIHEVLVSSAPSLLGIALFFELMGAVLIFIGFKMRIGALLLLLFLIPVTLIFHPFWFKIGALFQEEMQLFLRNLSLIGALLYLLASPRPERERR